MAFRASLSHDAFTEHVGNGPCDLVQGDFGGVDARQSERPVVPRILECDFGLLRILPRGQSSPAHSIRAVQQDPWPIRPIGQLVGSADAKQHHVGRENDLSDQPDQPAVGLSGLRRLRNWCTCEFTRRTHERVPVEHNPIGQEFAQVRNDRTLARSRCAEHIVDHPRDASPS